MDIQIDENSVKPVGQSGQPSSGAALGLPDQSVDNSTIDPNTIKPITEATPKLNTHETTISAQPKPTNVGAQIKQWTDNVANDLKYGTDLTGVGTLLKKMGAHGVYTGNPQAVGDFMASLPLGLLKAGGGLANAHNQSWQSAKDITGGLLQALDMPGAFIAPEAAEATADTAGAATGAAAEAVGTGVNAIKSGARRVVQAFREPTEPDTEALATSAMRGVQPRIQGGLRSTMKAVENDGGIQTPAGATPEPPIEQQSIRTAIEKTADKFYARAKTAYAELDKATGGQFQRFDNQLRALRQEVREFVSHPTEENLYKEADFAARKAQIEEAQNLAYERAAAENPEFANLIESSKADFKKSQALYDLDFHVKRSTSGSRPDIGAHLEDLAKDPELVDPKKLATRLNQMYDSGRLQEAVGTEKANKMLADASKHLVDHKTVLYEAKRAAAARIRTNKNIRTGATIAASTIGAGAAAKIATHMFVPGRGVVPIE